MRKIIMTITCNAPLELWTLDFEELTPEEQKLFTEGKIPCRESGMLDSWCGSCQFGDVDIDEEG